MAAWDVAFDCAFHYPAMSPQAMPLAISVRSCSSPLWSPHPDLQVPFHTARRNRLFVVTLRVAAGGYSSNTLVLFVPSSTILDILNSLPPDVLGKRFEWAEWGPSGTRMRFAPSGRPPWTTCRHKQQSLPLRSRQFRPHYRLQPCAFTHVSEEKFCRQEG